VVWFDEVYQSVCEGRLAVGVEEGDLCWSYLYPLFLSEDTLCDLNGFMIVSYTSRNS
jgi:hypothetical protein